MKLRYLSGLLASAERGGLTTARLLPETAKPLAGVPARRTRFLLCLALLGLPLTVLAGPMFMGLGDLPGGYFGSAAYGGVSPDGQYVAGGSYSLSGQEAFLWGQGSGMQGLGVLPGGPFFSVAMGVSADGQAVVGYSNSNSGWRAFRWTSTNGMQNLGVLPGGSSGGSLAYGVSDDGLTVVGESYSALGGRAFLWTPSGGMQDLGILPGSIYSGARGVSADGQTVVGYSHGSSGTEATLWKQGVGILRLGDLSGGSFYSAANGVSPDGQTVVGYSSGASGQEAFRWTSTTGMQGLGVLPGGSTSFALDTSANGKTVVGYSTVGSYGGAFIWTEDGGMRELKSVLESNYGLSLTGWSLGGATGISDDGLTIVGYGTDPAGQAEAWLARLGDPLPFVVGDPATKPQSGQLTFASVTGFNPALPTVVLTHGWQPGGQYIDATGQPTAFPMGSLQEAIESRCSGQCNVISYQWPQAYTETPLTGVITEILMDMVSGKPIPTTSAKVAGEFISALSFVQAAGTDLANKLATILPAGYTGDIQLIGHSLGTMVNAEAANALSGEYQIDQITLLDPPLGALPVIGQWYFYDALPKGTVDYVDNFYALLATGGAGGPLPAAAPDITALTGQYLLGGELVFEHHTGVWEDFYTKRVKDENGQWITAALPDRFADRPIPQAWDPANAPGVLEYVAMIAAEFWDAVINHPKEAWEAVVDLGGKVLKVFLDAADQVIDVIGETTEKILSVTKDAVTGAIQAVVDTGTEIKTFFGNLIGKVLDLKESSPVVVKQTVSIPVDASLLTFDFDFVDVGDGDWVTLYFDDQLLWTFLGQDFINELMHATIPIGLFAGRTGDLYFALNDVGDPNAEVLISNMGFVGMRQASNPSVPEPATLALLAVGLVMLHLAARRYRPVIR